MELDILLVIIATTFIQAIFGVGVLLFGTPLLLIQGYDFISAITVLLPISLSINLIQIIKDYKNIDLSFYKNILLYTIPFVVLSLVFITRVNINITIIVGVFVLLAAIKDYSSRAHKIVGILVGYERTYFAVMGMIHGMTNLGGSLLTAIVHSRKYPKRMTRATVALSYASFALFQMLTLVISGYTIDLTFSGVGIYLIAGVTVFFLTELLIFVEISNYNYTKYFATLLLLTGILLCVKSY